MVKVKQSAVKVAKKNTTAAKVSKGKIKKNRVHVTTEKSNAKENEHNDNINNYLEIQSKVGLVFVKLKRINRSNISASNDSITTNANKSDTLQDQCSNAGGTNNDAIKASKKKAKETTSAGAKGQSLQSKQKKSLRNLKSSTKDGKISIVETETLNTFADEITVVNTRKRTQKDDKRLLDNNPKSMETESLNANPAPTESSGGRRVSARVKNVGVPTKTKSNVSKEQQLQTSLEKSIEENNPKLIETDSLNANPSPTESSGSRRVSARVKNVGVPTKRKSNVNLSEVVSAEVSKEQQLQRCEVRICRNSSLEKSIEDKNSRSHLVNNLSSSSISENVNTILDEEKRNAFRKLSLPKTKERGENCVTNDEINESKNAEDHISINTAISQNAIASHDQTPLRPKPTERETRNNILENVTAEKTNDNIAKNAQIPSRTKKTKFNINKIHFVPQINSTMCFEHSIISQNNVEKNTNINSNKQKPVEKKTTNSSANLGNKMIISPANNRTQKFFHRQETAKNKNNSKMTTNKRRLLIKRSSQVKRENVYDFLSQSQTSDSDGNLKVVKPVDPNADIIKKLIAQGKVAVATNRKGRPVLKRIIRKRKPIMAAKKNNKIKITNKNVSTEEDANNNMQGKEATTKTQHVANNQEHNHEDAEDFDNFMDDHFDDGDFDMNEIPIEAETTKRTAHHVTDQDGTFSNLARSVLISQAGKTDPKRLKAQRLLAMAKKLISTPINHKAPQTNFNADISPILMSKTRPATIPSPWRVDEDIHLPRVFNFSRSSGNLPSFSSDFIPSTPRKETHKQRTLNTLNELSENQVQTETPPNQSISHMTEGLSLSIPSSFSSNDSNAENKTPPKANNNHKTTDNNENIFDLKQLPNPRRTLRYRSPLKAINILEVVHLPPIQNLNGITSKEKPHLEMFGFEEMAANDTFKSPQLPTKTKPKKTIIEEDLFGFEEYLLQSDISTQGSSQTSDASVQEVNNTINDKLHSLRKLRPDSPEIPIIEQQAQASTVYPNLFNDGENIAKPQKSIKEMLCSTMIQQPSTSKQALDELRARNLKANQAFNCVIENSSNISELFKDPEPETTFNEEDPHRTYIRPFKRKRRLRENNLIYVYDSDLSEDEDGSSPEKKKRGHHDSHETDTSSEQKQPQAKKKRKFKEKPELQHFVEEFNDMCKDVESYELIVEKSA